MSDEKPKLKRPTLMLEGQAQEMLKARNEKRYINSPENIVAFDDLLLSMLATVINSQNHLIERLQRQLDFEEYFETENPLKPDDIVKWYQHETQRLSLEFWNQMTELETNKPDFDIRPRRDPYEF